jgi:hypothetical protein
MLPRRIFMFILCRNGRSERGEFSLRISLEDVEVLRLGQ